MSVRRAGSTARDCGVWCQRHHSQKFGRSIPRPGVSVARALSLFVHSSSSQRSELIMIGAPIYFEPSSTDEVWATEELQARMADPSTPSSKKLHRMENVSSSLVLEQLASAR